MRDSTRRWVRSRSLSITSQRSTAGGGKQPGWRDGGVDVAQGIAGGVAGADVIGKFGGIPAFKHEVDEAVGEVGARAGLV